VLVAFSVQTGQQNISWQELTETWERLETLGYDGAWLRARGADGEHAVRRRALRALREGSDAGVQIEREVPLRRKP
jgi:hypothetical protein